MTNAQGIDISKWQTATPSLSGLDFAFARATYGDTIDSRYGQHSQAIRAAGLVLGAYHFGRSGQYASIKSQVALFLFKSTGADLLALDFESDGVKNTAMSRVEAADFIAKVHAAGHSIGLYHSDSGFPSDLGEDWRWVAKWSKTPPSRKWDIWQYRGSPLDLDEFHGTPDELQVFAGLKLPDTSTGGTVVRVHLKAEDWLPTVTDGKSNGCFRAVPDRSEPVIGRVSAGVKVRSTAEVTTDSPKDNNWRLTRFNDADAFMLRLRLGTRGAGRRPGR